MSDPAAVIDRAVLHRAFGRGRMPGSARPQPLRLIVGESPERAAADLIAEHGWGTASGARGRCGTATARFQQLYPQAGAVRVWTDYGLGPAEFGHRRAEHNAALLHGRVYDLTAAQFDDEATPGPLDLDDWFEQAAGWLRPGDDDLVIAEVYTASSRLRRSWRLPPWEFM